MKHFIVVGSGPTGVHFALTLLKRGHRVTMLDTGHRRTEPAFPDASFDQLKDQLPDPVSWFLGPQFDAIVLPGTRESFYAFPPSKNFVFATPRGFSFSSTNMQPRFSFAQGGLAESWTGGVYPYTDTDLVDYPIGYADLKPAYQEIARRIGISAERDDLEQFMPFEADYLDPLPLDAHSSHLLSVYARRRKILNRAFGAYIGRSRVATISRDYAGRKACNQCGRCLLGCPTRSIYSPTSTLSECLGYTNFEYRPGVLVTDFSYTDDHRLTGFGAVSLEDGSRLEFRGDEYVLAAGTLLSAKILLDSVYRKTGQVESLTGLMDNRMIHLPFLTLAMVGGESANAKYQFHHLALGLVARDPRDYLHGQITTLKGASVHPILQSMPVNLRSAVGIFRTIRSGLGLANVSLSDRRRPESRITIEPMRGSAETKLVIDYHADSTEPQRIARAIRRTKRALSLLGAIVPPGLTRVLPAGGGIHYAGTIPMSAAKQRFACSKDCRSHDFRNLLIVDGSTLPFLPSKNHTFTLMANAVRAAEHAS